MKNLYGVPASVSQSGLQEKFSIPFEFNQVPQYDLVVEKLLSSAEEAKSFLNDSIGYFKHHNLSNIHLDKESDVYNRLRLQSDSQLSDAIKDDDASLFIDILKKYNYLPDEFLLRSDDSPKPRVAVPIVFVTPAAVYTVFGAVASVVATVAGVVAIGIKVITSGSSRLHGWASTEIHDSIPIALSIAHLMGGVEFAHKVDAEICNLFLKEVKSRTKEQSSIYKYTLSS